MRSIAGVSLSLILVALGVALGVAPAALAEPPPPPPTLESQLAALWGRAGGLTAEAVARRAEATSYDVMARKQDLIAAGAAVDAAKIAFVPRLNLTARYMRLSSVPKIDFTSSSSTSDAASLGSLVVTGTLVPAGKSAQPLAPCAAPGGMGCDTLIAVSPSVLSSLFPSFPIPVDNTLMQASLAVPLTDYLLRLNHAYDAAGFGRDAAASAERAARYKVAADARVLYYTWARTRLSRFVAEQALVQANGHLADVRHLFDVGMVPNADVMRVESAQAGAELLVEKSRNFERLLADQIRVAMHERGGPEFQIGEDLGSDPAPLPDTADTEGLITSAEAGRLELALFRDNDRALEAQQKINRAGYLPRIDAFGDAVYANPNQRIFPQKDQFDFTWDVGVQLTYTPNDVGTTLANARTIEARRASLAAQRGQLLDGIRLEVLQAASAAREATVAMKTTARGLKAAEESYRVRRELYVNGRATNIELTDAENELTRARLDAIGARLDLRIAAIRLEHATAADVGGPRN